MINAAAEASLLGLASSNYPHSAVSGGSTPSLDSLLKRASFSLGVGGDVDVRGSGSNGGAGMAEGKDLPPPLSMLLAHTDSLYFPTMCMEVLENCILLSFFFSHVPRE